MRVKILILGLARLLMLGSAFSTEEKHIKSWLDYFPDPVERIYIIMKDSIAFKQTNYEECLVHLSAGILEKTLKKMSYEISTEVQAIWCELFTKAVTIANDYHSEVVYEIIYQPMDQLIQIKCATNKGLQPTMVILIDS